MEGFFPTSDKLAVINGLSPQEILQSLTLENVKTFLESLGVEPIETYSDHLVCPTICHNPIESATSMKLYYYDRNKQFHCYTECNENFNIFTLYMKYMSLNERDIDEWEAIDYVRHFVENIQYTREKRISHSLNIERYRRASNEFEFKPYDENVLSLFVKYHHPSWLAEGITAETMDKFEIEYSISQNKIVIPHRDFYGNLVGVRGRAFEKQDLEIGKYMPIKVGEILYNHQLGFNLYGIWQNKDAIKRNRKAIIFESEKSVLLSNVYYGDSSIAVACCGSSINKFQIDMLVRKLGVNEIVVAFDKEFVDYRTTKAKNYRAKLVSICDKYKHLTNFSYIFDEKNLLQEKDSPVDRGKETFEQLYNERIMVK